MKNLIFTFICFFISPILNAQITIQSADGVEITVKNTDKIITIGGSITEIVYALGMGKNVIATDQSSTHPPEVLTMPRVPYVRNLSSEGVLSLQADLIIASDEVKPPSAVQQIRDTGVPFIIVKEEDTFEGVEHKIKTIGKILGTQEKAEELIQLNKNQYESTQNTRKDLSTLPKVMFVLSMRNGRFMVAGRETGAQSIIELAGGVNAFASFTGYKTVTNESIISENPDFILAMGSRAHNIGEGLKDMAGISSINAVVNDAIITMDGNYLLGFGPRFGSALITLMKELHSAVDLEISQ